MVDQNKLLLNPTFAQARERLPTPLKVITSPVLTAGLVATLGTLLFPAAGLAVGRAAAKILVPKTLGGAAKTAFVVGAITAAPEIAKTFNPFEAGRKAAPFIADPSKLLPKDTTPEGVKEKVIDIVKDAGLVGGAAAAVAGAGLLVAKAVKKKVKSIIPSVSAPIAAVPLITSIKEPLGAVQKPVSIQAPIPKMPSIKITNKPEININFRKSKKFINQQVLIN